MLTGIIDPDLGYYSKLEQTQHCWRFEAVTPCSYFPIGAKTTYRAYNSSRVIAITKKGSACITRLGQLTGLEPETLYCCWYPAKDTIPNRDIEGFYLMTKMPKDEGMIPAEFPEDSFAQIAATLREVRKTYSAHSDERNQWDSWQRDHCPKQDETAAQYIVRLPESFHVPLALCIFMQ